MGRATEFIDFINRKKLPNYEEQIALYPHISITEELKIIRQLTRRAEKMRSKAKWLPIWESRFPEFIEQIEEIRKTITDKDILNKSVDELELSCRPRNCLESKSIRTIGELIVKNPYKLLFINNMGVKSVKEIIIKLRLYIINKESK